MRADILHGEGAAIHIAAKDERLSEEHGFHQPASSQCPA
jgi:hypothetical protein